MRPLGLPFLASAARMNFIQVILFSAFIATLMPRMRANWVGIFLWRTWGRLPGAGLANGYVRGVPSGANAHESRPPRI
jgi:hypothetical protein